VHFSAAFFRFASCSSARGSMTSTLAPADQGDQVWVPFLSTATRRFSSKPPNVNASNVTFAAWRPDAKGSSVTLWVCGGVSNPP